MGRWTDYIDERSKVTPLYDTWYGDEEVFANYGGYDGDDYE